MPELSELITSRSVLDLKKAFDDGVDFLAERSTKRPIFHIDEMEIAEPMVRFVYTQLMMSSTRAANPPHPGYPWRTTRYVKEVLKDNGAHFNVDHLARQVFSLLVGNGIGFKTGTGKSHFYLRVWNEGEPLRWFPHNARTTPVDYRVEKRIAEENGKPVAVYRNLRKIALPKSFDPESVKTWVENFVPAAMALQAEYDALRAEVEELRSKMEVIEKEDWSEVSNALTAAFEATPDG